MPDETGTAIVVQAVELGTLRANNPAGVLAAASELATPLAKLIADKKLYSDIQGKRYVRCEGWTTLAAMLGVTPHEVSVTEHDGAFTATVELRRLSDSVSVARASAECGGDEPQWDGRPRYARRSMALTRATAKACRLAFSWIMVLGGYEATPAEEIPTDDTVRLPGAPEKWDGHGGKPITEVPDRVLVRVKDWMEKKDAKENAALVTAINDLLDERRADGDGSHD